MYFSELIHFSPLKLHQTMRLYAKCKSCPEDIILKSSVPTRMDLAKMEGNELELTCQNCKTRKTCHVDDIRAQFSTRKILIAIGFSLILALVGTLLLLDAGFISTLTIGIPIIVALFVYKQENAAVHLFNRHKTSSRR